VATSNPKRIWFHFEDVSFRLRERNSLRTWLFGVVQNEGFSTDNVNYIFTNDTRLHEINLQYLGHDTLTDIITFDFVANKRISGDIFISVDRVVENSKKFAQTRRNELHRVMVHGMLHLLGYPDKTKEEKRQMTAKEDYYLSLRNF